MTRPGGDKEPPGAGARAKEGLAQLAETRLWYTDAGSTGPAVVFLHPASGSALVWGLTRTFPERGLIRHSPDCRRYRPTVAIFRDLSNGKSRVAYPTGGTAGR